MADLKTQRLVLQPISPAHIDGLYSAIIASRAELLPWMPWAQNPTIESTRLYAAEASAARIQTHEYHFAAVELRSELVLGVVSLNREDATNSLELHYWMRSDHTGQGPTEACLAIIKWAVAALEASHFTLWAGRDNLASRRVAEKLGLADVGPLGWDPEGGQGTFPAESYELTMASTMRGIR